jgi:predicted nucleic acid-binding protein
MTPHYLDSSALIKRYVAEPGSDWLKVTVFEPDDALLLTSRVTMVEVWSALARRRREVSISLEHHADALDAFREDCLKQYRFVEFEESVTRPDRVITGAWPGCASWVRVNPSSRLGLR